MYECIRELFQPIYLVELKPQDIGPLFVGPIDNALLPESQKLRKLQAVFDDARLDWSISGVIERQDDLGEEFVQSAPLNHDLADEKYFSVGQPVI
jgi:hypothetical protein